MDPVSNSVGQFNKFSPWVPILPEKGNYCLSIENPALARNNVQDTWRVGISGAGIDPLEIIWKVGSAFYSLEKLVGNSSKDLNGQLTFEGRTTGIFITKIDGISTAEQIAWLANKNCKPQALRLLAEQVYN